MTITHMGVEVREEKTTLVRVKLNAAGYTGTGHYYGDGPPLFWYAVPTGDGKYLDGFVRAKDREDAKVKVRETHRLRRINFYV